MKLKQTTDFIDAVTHIKNTSSWQPHMQSLHNTKDTGSWQPHNAQMIAIDCASAVGCRQIVATIVDTHL